MELAAVFLLSLLGGYLFSALWRFTAFATRRTDGHHLYFRAAIWGAAFFVVALLLRVALLTKWQAYKELENALTAYIAPAMKDPKNPRQVELVIIAGYSLVLGPLFAGLANLITPRRWALRRTLSGFDDLLFRAQRQEMPVQITLANGKVYIGIVVQITDPDRPPASVTLFPMFSGRRDEDGRLRLTTDYNRVYAELEKSPEKRNKLKLPKAWQKRFEIVIRADSILTASMFSPNVYSEFNPKWREALRSQAAPPSPPAKPPAPPAPGKPAA